MKRFSWFVASCLLSSATIVNAQTLEQAVANTLATNPELKSAYNDFMSYVKDIDAAEGAYLPSIDLDAGIGYEGVDSATSSERTDLTRKEASVTLNQLIWDGSATLNNIDRVSAEAESMRYLLIASAQDKALEVAEIYLEAVKSEEVLALSESNLAVHKKIYKDIKRRAESGIGSTADVTQVEARLAKAHGNLLAAQNNIFDTHTQFTRLVGQSPQGLVFPRADAEAIAFTFDEALERAYDDHPVIKTATVDVEAARFQYEQSKGVNYPTISFEAEQAWRDDAGGISGSSSETSIMLRLRYNLYNGGSDDANTERAAYQLNKAKDLRDDTFRSVKESLQLAWNALDLTLQQKEFLADHVDSASETVISYEKQYRIGKRTLLDLLNTENELFEARKDYIDAHYAEQLAKYRVMNASGNLLDALRVDMPQEWLEKIDY
ncbi:TolC family outer membrane protein [Vibrio sp. SCSIO 43136]|uniref:TolC family outer membrane protein n=1 Tax=Vibrio sp. SCSIO 43136 TaxID=2819101 RepID=UPI0020751DC8|nr:TolC family outer membrane protein [Vibrio sp. SCSIO 43136]USD66500.1 TolC family outer membrane protein [Vibrio sp. SCSIO 43136]